MHNIKSIRDKPDFYKKKIKDRNVNVDIDKLLNLDEKNRDLIQKKEKLEQEKKIISKSKDSSQFQKSKDISNEIKSLEKELNRLKYEINKILHFLPNIACDDVPIGPDESKTVL